MLGNEGNGRDACPCEPILSKKGVKGESRTRTCRKVAARLLSTDIKADSKLAPTVRDVYAFSTSLLGMLDLETQIMVFDCVATDDAITFVRLCTVCKWMHSSIRALMHSTLQEQACRLACSKVSLLSMSAPDSYIEQFAMEMRCSFILRHLKQAFSMMALHCASSHCSLAIGAYNRALLKDRDDSKRYRGCRTDSTLVKLERMGMIHVAYHRSAILAAAHDAPVAFVATQDNWIHNGHNDGIVRVDAGQERTVWSPHSEMAVSTIFNPSGVNEQFIRVVWMTASHDASALLYAVSVGSTHTPWTIGPVTTYLWDMASQTSYRVRFVSMACEAGLPVDPATHGWQSLDGWFRKNCKAPVECNSLNFAVVFQHEDWSQDFLWPRLVRHSIWQYRFCRSTKKLVCTSVGWEGSDTFKEDERLSQISNDVSGRWMGCRVLRKVGFQSIACMIDIDNHDERAIFCCPKAMGERFQVSGVAVSPAGDRLAMMCFAHQSVCVEVHERISESACVRSMHIPLNSSNESLGDLLTYDSDNDHGDLTLTFSPCGRFLVWKVSDDVATALGDELQGLASIVISKDVAKQQHGVRIYKLNTVRSNMPRYFCWRKCGVWMRLRRGAVLVHS